MDHATAIAAFFVNGDKPVPAPVLDAGPARRLRDAFEPVAMHAVWSELVAQRFAAHGLDFFESYVWGRAVVLGEPVGAVVAATFAAFEPGLIAQVYESARAKLSRDEALALVVGGTGESLRAALGGADVQAALEPLQRAVAEADPTGRALFASVQALPWPDDPYARLWQACLALREHRGDAHVIAYLGEGFDAVQMNVLTELWLDYDLGEYSASRAWSEARTAAALDELRRAGLLDGDRLTEAGRARRQAVEDRTDALCAGVVASLGDRLDEITTSLDRWSAACVAARSFPPDPRKRAGG